MAESSSAYKLRKNCVDSQIKRSSDNREKIDLCQKYDGTQIAERRRIFIFIFTEGWGTCLNADFFVEK